MLFSFIKLLIGSTARERAQTEERRRELSSVVNRYHQVELPPADARRMLAAAEASVRPLLCQPTSAEFSDCTIHSRGELGHVVCGVVESRNSLGEAVRNYFVAEILSTVACGGSELFEDDPRLRETESRQ